MQRVLSLLVPFALTIPLSSMAKSPSQDDEQQAYVSGGNRGSVRIAFFSQKSSGGQVALDWGLADWKDEYQKAIESKKFVGKRWRLGKDFWTNVDAFFDFKLNGTTIKAGYYYLTLEMKKDGSYILGFHDPAVIRKNKLDAFLAEQYKGAAAVEVALDHEDAKQVAKQLQFQIEPSENQPTQGVFSLTFGPHKLKASFEALLGKSTQ